MMLNRRIRKPLNTHIEEAKYRLQYIGVIQSDSQNSEFNVE